MDFFPRSGTFVKVRGLSEMVPSANHLQGRETSGKCFFGGQFLGSARAAAGHGGGDLYLCCAAFENSPQGCWKGKLVAGGGGWEVH